MFLSPEKSESKGFLLLDPGSESGVTSLAKGFTIIELLVVIAVLALLMAIILPALNSAKLSAKQIVCAAKMKQWTLAELAYTQENDLRVTPYADTSNTSGNALNPETYYHYRLSAYLTEEDYGQWGMDDVRKCPMGRASWGETAVWIGVYYGLFSPEYAPFIFLNDWNGSVLTKKCSPFKISTVKSPSDYFMMTDTNRDLVASTLKWPWIVDFDSDGLNDSNNTAVPYNRGQPKIHRGGCNVGLFDGHVEWISYKEFWDVDANGQPTHRYWWNNNRP